MQKLARAGLAFALAFLVCYALFRGFVLLPQKEFLEFTGIVASSITAVVAGVVAWKAFKSPTTTKLGESIADWIKK